MTRRRRRVTLAAAVAGAPSGTAYYLEPACSSSSDATAQFTKWPTVDGRFSLQASNGYWVCLVSPVDGQNQIGLQLSESSKAYFREMRLG